MRSANRSANSPTTARPGSVSTLMARLRWTVGRYGCGGTNRQNVLELRGRVGIELGGQAHLGEAQTSQLEQRVVSRDTPLEQAMNRPEHP